ncbi:hypothetical protein ZIOFF_061578 [Zingiber officinale]|uniref:IQ domain-containing protein IQM3 n=1 Tax=Zingiber officinale TaxID=94328 RepID=A0A8J5EZU8_ZINOF|nr:hypothetical protein ZIOFF_061578 [Zingiber officinale]
MQVEPLSIIRSSLDHAPPAFQLPEEPESPGSGQDPAFMKGMEVSDDGGCRSSNPPKSAAAATKLQKVYRSYRTRRRLADSAVVAEELWWQAIEFVQLNRSTVSFFDHVKQESVISRWNRVKLNASKARLHIPWPLVRAYLRTPEPSNSLFNTGLKPYIDPRHRYGHNLHIYYEEWRKSEAGQPFFYWLDIGDGRDLDLDQCPRSFLRKQCVIYLGPQEREHYEYVPLDGKLVHKQTGVLLDTTSAAKGGKWIFVMSTSRKLYAGQKKKGIFHHSSFLAGGATVAAGRFTAENGMLKRIWAYSGHYRPTEENFNNFLSFLKENHVNLDDTEIMSSSNEDYYEDAKNPRLEEVIESMKVSRTPQLALPLEVTGMAASEPTAESKSAVGLQVKYQRTLSGGLQSPRADVPKKAILERINSKRKASSYQLGHQLSSKWCSGAGPRIGCVADYPVEVRLQALEFVNLSPRMAMPPKGQSSKSLATP